MSHICNVSIGLFPVFLRMEGYTIQLFLPFYISFFMPFTTSFQHLCENFFFIIFTYLKVLVTYSTFFLFYSDKFKNSKSNAIKRIYLKIIFPIIFATHLQNIEKRNHLKKINKCILLPGLILQFLIMKLVLNRTENF